MAASRTATATACPSARAACSISIRTFSSLRTTTWSPTWALAASLRRARWPTSQWARPPSPPVAVGTRSYRRSRLRPQLICPQQRLLVIITRQRLERLQWLTPPPAPPQVFPNQSPPYQWCPTARWPTLTTTKTLARLTHESCLFACLNHFPA